MAQVNIGFFISLWKDVNWIMKDYSILLNQTYLYLKQYPIDKVNYSKIAGSLGLSRQTVSKEFAQIELMGNDYEINRFYEDIEDKYERAIKIIEDLEGKKYSMGEYAIMLKVSKSVLEEHCNGRDS